MHSHGVRGQPVLGRQRGYPQQEHQGEIRVGVPDPRSATTPENPCVGVPNTKLCNNTRKPLRWCT